MHLITADKMQRGEYTMIKIKWHQENEPRMHVNTREGVTYLTYPEFDRLRDLCMHSAPDLAVSVRGSILL